MKLICPHCQEEIKAGDILAKYASMMDGRVTISHYECDMRAIIGGVNHQLKLCTCFGGNVPNDPDGMTKRQAAKAAVKLWETIRKSTGEME